MRATPSLPTTMFAGQSSPWMAPSGRLMPSRSACSACKPGEDVEQDANEHRHGERRLVARSSRAASAASMRSSSVEPSSSSVAIVSSRRGARRDSACRTRAMFGCQFFARHRASRKQERHRLGIERRRSLGPAGAGSPGACTRTKRCATSSSCGSRIAAYERCAREPSSRSVRYVAGPDAGCAPFDIGVLRA